MRNIITKFRSAILSDQKINITDANKSSKAANSAFMLAGQFIGKGSLFVSMMFLSRYLPDEDFGGLLFSIALGQMYLILSDLGVSLVLNMRSSMRLNETQELLSTAFTLRIILCLLGFPLLMLAGLLLNMSSERMLVLGIIGISVVFESFTEMIYSIFRAREKMIYESICRILMGLIGLTAVLLLILFRMNLTSIAAAYVIRTFAATIIAIVFLKKIGFSVLPSINMKKVKELLIASLPIGIMGLLTVTHQRVDNILIRQMLGENAVAAWQECLKIIELMLLMVVPTLLPGALFSSLCRSFRDGGYQRQTGNMARIFTGLAVVLSLSVISTGDRFLRFMWGSDYLRNISSSELQLVLYLCLGGLAAVYLWNILISALLALNKVRIVVPVTTAALILVVGGNLLLMPVIGLPSAGIFFLVGNLLMVFCYWAFLRWRGYPLPIWREAAISILVSIPVFTAVILIRGLPFLPALFLPALIYILFWWLTGGRRAVREVFPHKTE